MACPFGPTPGDWLLFLSGVVLLFMGGMRVSDDRSTLRTTAGFALAGLGVVLLAIRFGVWEWWLSR